MRYRWFVTIAVVLGLALIGVFAYNAGVSHGFAQAAAAAAAQAGQAAQGATPAAPLPLYPYTYGWYRPWGFGFPIFPIVLLLFFWLFVVRGLFWGGPWRRWHHYRDVPPSFDEWHRRAHERMQGEAPRTQA